jgi:hypothetical protein
MRIDAWMPEYHYIERHHTLVRAKEPIVYQALMEVDVGAHPVVRLLLGLRALPALLLRCQRLAPSGRSLTLRNASAYGFVFLEERAPHEVVLGLTGCFWQLSGGHLPTNARDFRGDVPAGSARAAWNFALSPAPAGGTLLSTETRIRCADRTARRAFGRYWLLVRAGSGLLRRVMLRLVKVEAERRAAQGAGADRATAPPN